MGEDAKGRKPLSVADYLWGELRQAFQDVRQKLVEEGWFGRVVTAAPVVEMERDQSPENASRNAPAQPERDHPSFDEMWAVREHASSPAMPEHGMEIEH
jgi:hypothetical protein